MKKCDCYIEKQVIKSWPISITEPRCNGTREQDMTVPNVTSILKSEKRHKRMCLSKMQLTILNMVLVTTFLKSQ